MSRAKFEEFYAPGEKCTNLDRELLLYGQMYRAWIAGRESMREDAAKSCEEKADRIYPEGTRSNQVDRHVADVIDRHAEEIRKIEL